MTVQKPLLPVVNRQIINHFNTLSKRLSAVNTTTLTRDALMAATFDPRRNIYEECGYPTGAIPTSRYQELFDREGVARRVVEVLAKETWQVHPTVYEVEDVEERTPFEIAWRALGRSLCGYRSLYRDEEGSPVWDYLRRLDEQAGIGRYGVLLLGLGDGRPLSEPVAGVEEAVLGGITYGKGEEGGENGSKKGQKEPKNGPKTPQNGDIPLGTDAQYYEPYSPAKKPVRNKLGPKVPQKGQKLPKNAQNPLKTPKTGDIPPTDPSAPSSSIDPIEPMEEKDPRLVEEEEVASLEALNLTKLLYLRVFSESLVRITKREVDTSSPRFGQPTEYLITLNKPEDLEGGAGPLTNDVYVHWTRIIHFADQLDNSEIFGTPRLQPVLNNVLGLQKLYCASPEMYWKGAFFGLSLETHPDFGVEVEIDDAAVKDAIENYMNGLQRYLNLVGMTAKSLAPQVVDPTPMIVVQLTAIAIKLGMPMRILMGSERGELASSQDDADWNDEVRGRQRFLITPRLIVAFVDRLIHAGVLPEPRGYSIAWPDLTSQTDTEKSNVALTRTQAMIQYVGGEGDKLMTPLDYLTTILKLEEAEAAEIISRAKAYRVEREAENVAKGLTPDGEPIPVIVPPDPNNPDAPSSSGKGFPSSKSTVPPGKNKGEGSEGPPEVIEQSNQQK